MYWMLNHAILSREDAKQFVFKVTQEFDVRETEVKAALALEVCDLSESYQSENIDWVMKEAIDNCESWIKEPRRTIIASDIINFRRSYLFFTIITKKEE